MTTHGPLVLMLALCGAGNALADTTTTTADAQQLDPATRQELHRQRLATEFQLLNEARTTTFGSDFGVEGRLFTLRFALMNETQESPLRNFMQQQKPRWAQQFMDEHIAKAGPQDTVNDVTSVLPPFRMTLGGEGKTFHAQLGAIETTLGHGELVNRYLNNPAGRFNLNAMGLVLGAQARSVGGQVVTGSLLDPARFAGFNVKGRPLEWIWGTYTNFAPEQAGNFDAYALLLSMLTIGVSGAIDTTAPTTAFNYVKNSGGNFSKVPPIPGTAGGLSVEADVGINHDILAAHGFANVTMLGRTFREAALGPDGTLSTTGTTNLWGAGGAVGGRFNIFLELIKIGGSLEYRLAGPNYMPAYFDRYYEADRIFGAAGGPKITQRTLARHGYNLELGAQLLKTIGVFMEANDMIPLDWRLGHNNATVRVGGILHVLGIASFMGAYVNRGFQDYLRVMDGSTGSMWLGEARLNLAILHLVARKWRTWDRQPSNNSLYARDGYSMLAEIVIGIL